MFLAPRPDADYAWFMKPFEGLLVSANLGDGMHEAIVLLGAGIGLVGAALCGGLILSALQAVLAKMLYGSTVRTKRYVFSTIAVNTAYVASFGAIGYGLFMGSLSMSFGSSDPALPFLAFVPFAAFVLLCILQHRINRRAAAPVLPTGTPAEPTPEALPPADAS
jgi:hypothetical protein